MMMETSRTGRLLLVENDTDVQLSVREAAQHTNLQAETATDGWDAIEMLEANRYDVVVVDLAAPQKSGYGVVDYLREQYGYQLHNVLLIRSGKEDRDTADSITAGVIDRTATSADFETAIRHCMSVR